MSLPDPTNMPAMRPGTIMAHVPLDNNATPKQIANKMRALDHKIKPVATDEQREQFVKAQE